MRESIHNSENSPRYPLYGGLAEFLFWSERFVGDNIFFLARNHTTIFRLPACNVIAISAT